MLAADQQVSGSVARDYEAGQHSALRRHLSWLWWPQEQSCI